jgi:hypothetical protein
MNNHARLISLAISLWILMVWLTGCSQLAPAAGPGSVSPSVTEIPAQPVSATEPVQAPVTTFTAGETLAPEETVIGPMKPTPENPYITSLAQQALQNLAARLNVPVDQIELLSFEDVVWPDGGLGCPTPGMVYTQVMVEGYRILLQHQGQVYAYHGGGSGPPFLCQNPKK